MKNVVFWDVAPMYCSHLLTLIHRSWISYTLKMEAIRFSETSVNYTAPHPRRRHYLFLF
jgi:hypothetical protein